MAYTKIHAIKRTLTKAIKYIENPEKTDGQLLVSGYNVDPLSAAVEYEMTAALAREVVGNYTKTGGNENIAYHMIQSFSPDDDLTPEKAHEIGKQLANAFLDGKHEYVISTHLDKGHIHNHIILNAVSFYDLKKFRSQPYKTAAKIRAISDRLCADNGLSIITPQSPLNSSYTAYMKRKQNTAYRSEIRKRLSYILAEAASYEQFKAYAARLGVTIDDTKKHIRFRLTQEGQERYTRGDKLSDTGIFLKDGILETTKLNAESQRYIKEAIQQAVQESVDYEAFLSVLKKKHAITCKASKSGELIYTIQDVNSSTVKEEALGTSYCKYSIRQAILHKEISFPGEEVERDIYAEYNQITQSKTEDKDTRVILETANISRITKEGILLLLSDNDQNKVFIDSNHVEFDQTTGKYAIYVGSKYDYYFSESTDSPERYCKGETLIRTLELQNDVKPTVLEISAADIQSIGEKGLTLSIPDLGIDSVFIERQYVVDDRMGIGSCKVKLYPNWNYSCRRVPDQEERTPRLQLMTGSDLIDILSSRKIVKEQSIANRIQAMKHKSTIAGTKKLADTLLFMRQEKLDTYLDFNQKIDDLKAELDTLNDHVRTLNDKNTRYKKVSKYLLTFREYLPVQEQYTQLRGGKKRRFAAQHEGELASFAHAAGKLESLGVNANVDPDKVIALINEQNKQIMDLNKQAKEIAGQLDQITDMQTMIADVQEKDMHRRQNKDIQR